MIKTNQIITSSRLNNFAKTLRFETPDRLIFDLFGCPLSGMAEEALIKLKEFLGIQKTEDVLKHYDIDTRGVGYIFSPKDSLYKVTAKDEYIDEWGVTRKFINDYWEITGNPLKGATLEELKAFRFPNPDSIPDKEFEDLRVTAKELYEKTDYIICASHPTYGILELGCWMCGFDDFLYRMAGEPEFVQYFFERVLDYQKKVSERYYKALGAYIHYTSSGDDFATQTSTFVSPAMFDELIAPYFKERIDFTKKLTKAKFLHHSCGNVESLIPSLIKCGVDILNPVQPVGDKMKPAYFKKTYGGKIVFHGGYDTQFALPNNTPAQIDSEIKAFAAEIKRGGGFIMAAAHNIQRDVSPENVDAFLSSAKKYK